jgi:phosphate-selective porin OprO/OprP
MGEYIFSKQGAKRLYDETGSVRRAQLDNAAWYTEAGWVITGEDASYKGVTPKNNFDPRNGEWGAFEVAVRYSDVRVDEDTFNKGFATKPQSTGGATAYTFGVNWYLNRSFKFMFNYEHTDFDSPVEFSSLRDKEDVILTRFRSHPSSARARGRHRPALGLLYGRGATLAGASSGSTCFGAAVSWPGLDAADDALAVDHVERGHPVRAEPGDSSVRRRRAAS